VRAHNIRRHTLPDRCTEARERLAAEGLTVDGREGGLRPHPCIAIERDARAAFASLVRPAGIR
jgi:hypothetical protein